MNIIYNKIFLEHDTGMHPENKKRLICITDFGKVKESRVESGEKYLGLIHDKKYVDKVKEACKKGLYLDPDTFASKQSYDAAIIAVGATIAASQSGDFALVRPPGHHAHANHSSGFCIFNNLAISVQKLVNEGKKVLIFDFDGHLGDGTMDIFYKTDKVLYFSLHQYPAFPNKGWVDEIGEGKGKGYTINVPLPAGTSDDSYFDAIRRIMPILKKFNPDIVAISAGFDAYHGDLLLDLKLSYNAYYKIGKLLKDNFKNLYGTLEGGYNTDALPYCVFNFLDGINGKKQRFKDKSTRSPAESRKEYERRISELERVLRRYWGRMI
jgi:acetoin utilization deacetylase AcuC-like enzyme